MVICDMIWYLTFTRAMESSVRANFFFFAWKATRPDARENCENTWIQSKEAHPSRREVRAQAEQTRRGRSPPLLQNQRCNFSLIPAGWASIGKFSYLLSQIERIMRRKVDGIPAVMAENKIHNFFSASTWIRSFVLMGEDEGDGGDKKWWPWSRAQGRFQWRGQQGSCQTLPPALPTHTTRIWTFCIKNAWIEKAAKLDLFG